MLGHELRSSRFDTAVMLRRELRTLCLSFAVKLGRGLQASRFDIEVTLRRGLRALRLGIAVKLGTQALSLAFWCLAIENAGFELCKTQALSPAS